MERNPNDEFLPCEHGNTDDCGECETMIESMTEQLAEEEPRDPLEDWD